MEKENTQKERLRKEIEEKMYNKEERGRTEKSSREELRRKGTKE